MVALSENLAANENLFKEEAIAEDEADLIAMDSLKSEMEQEAEQYVEVDSELRRSNPELNLSFSPNLLKMEEEPEVEADIEVAEKVKPRVRSTRSMTLDLCEAEAAGEIESVEKQQRKKTLVDIRKVNGDDYLKMLLDDGCLEKFEFVNVRKELEEKEAREKAEMKANEAKREMKAKEEYEFGKVYDFSNSVRNLWPDFDYEKLDAKQIEESRIQNDELEQLKKELLEDAKSTVDEWKQVEINKIETETDNMIDDLPSNDVSLDELSDEDLDLETRLMNLNSFDSFDEKGSSFSLDTFGEVKSSKSRSDSLSVASRESSDDDDLSEGGDLPNEHWTKILKPLRPKSLASATKGLKKLTTLAWLSKSRKDTFKAKRDLRGELMSKGVNFKENELSMSDLCAAKRSLGREIAPSSVAFKDI